MKKKVYRGGIKTTCSKCGEPLEPELIGKSRYCKKCRMMIERLRRIKKKQEFAQAVRCVSWLKKHYPLIYKQFEEI